MGRRRNSAPGARGQPGTPPRWMAPSTRVGVFTPVPTGQLHQGGPVELAGLYRRHLARGDSHQRCRASAPLQMCALSEYGARPVLGKPLAVPVDPDDPVKNQVDASTGLSLADKHL